MRGLLLICLLPLLVFAFQEGSPVPTAPPWSRYSAFRGVDGIIFRWRADEGINPNGERFFEFEFRNRSDAPVRFTYFIEAESGERIVGSLSLGGQRTRLSGWYFKAASIRDVEAITPEALKMVLKKLGE